MQLSPQPGQVAAGPARLHPGGGCRLGGRAQLAGHVVLFRPRAVELRAEPGGIVACRLRPGQLPGQDLLLGGQAGHAAALGHRRAPGGLDGQRRVLALGPGALGVGGLAALAGFLDLPGGHRIRAGHGGLRVDG